MTILFARVRHVRVTRPQALLAIAALTAAAGQPRAFGSLLSWSNVAGGSAATSGNWSPVQVPVAGDDLSYSLASAYAVTFTATVPTSRTQTFRQGTVTLTMSSPHTTTTGITVGNVSGDVGNAIVTTGTWNSTASVTVGNASGSSGTLSVNDDDADLIITGATADLIVGVNGAGTLSISGGGLVQVADQFVLGSNSGSVPALTVSGVAGGLPITRSTLDVMGTTISSKIGQGGDANATISSGALAHFAGDVVVSNGSASTSTVTVGGTGGIIPQNATLDVAADLLLANNDNTAAPGTATLTVNDGGVVQVGGTLHVGDDPQGGAATLNINTGALVSATNVIDGAFGTINHSGGTLRIDGGTYTGHADPLVVTGAAANGVTLQLSNNLSKTLAPAGAVGLIVGDDTGAGTFAGSLIVDSGADLNVGNSDINIGDDAGVTGTVTVTGAGSRLIANSANSDIRVGFNGTGNLDVLDNAQCQFRNLLVPAINTATGDVDVNFGSLTTQFLAVGHASGAGSGTVQVRNGGTFTVTDPGFSTNIRSTGWVIIDGLSTFTTPGTVSIEAGGILSVHGSLTGAALVDVEGELHSGAAATTTPLVDAPVRVGFGGLIEVLAGDLTLGDAASTSGFDAQDGSVINIGAHTLTLNDSNRATVDDVTINGGEIIAPNGLEIVTPGQDGRLDGTGTITAPVLYMASGGSVITATGANGITINGRFHCDSGMIDGTKYTFNFNGLDSGWTGAGTINARVVFNSGTKIEAAANMTLGALAIDGVILNAGSEIHAFDNIVTLIDTNGVVLGSRTTLDGGQVVCAQPLTLSAGRSIEGNGTIRTPSLPMFGDLSPGDSPAGGIGFLTVTNVPSTTAMSMSSTSRVNIDVSGPLGGGIGVDAIEVQGGSVALAGELAVQLIGGFHPTAAGSWIIISAPSISGTFATTALPPHFSVQYTATTVRLRVCPADFNSSGTISVQDIFDFLAAYFSGDPAADFNGSGGISVQDIFDYLAAYFAGCP